MVTWVGGVFQQGHAQSLSQALRFQHRSFWDFLHARKLDPCAAEFSRRRRIFCVSRKLAEKEIRPGRRRRRRIAPTEYN